MDVDGWIDRRFIPKLEEWGFDFQETWGPRHSWFVLADAPPTLLDAFRQAESVCECLLARIVLCYGSATPPPQGGNSPSRKQKRNSEAITNRLLAYSSFFTAAVCGVNLNSSQVRPMLDIVRVTFDKD